MMMKMIMNKNEYVPYFNEKQPPDSSRKISVRILTLYEHRSGFFGPYNRHAELLDDVRKFLKTLRTEHYLKLIGAKRNRNREPSLLKNTQIEIRAFPIDENVYLDGSVHRHWMFLAYDLKN